jgi:hypothetical protein
MCLLFSYCTFCSLGRLETKLNSTVIVGLVILDSSDEESRRKIFTPDQVLTLAIIGNTNAYKKWAQEQEDEAGAAPAAVAPNAEGGAVATAAAAAAPNAAMGEAAAPQNGIERIAAAASQRLQAQYDQEILQAMDEQRAKRWLLGLPELDDDALRALVEKIMRRQEKSTTRLGVSVRLMNGLTKKCRLRKMIAAEKRRNNKKRGAAIPELGARAQVTDEGGVEDVAVESYQNLR